MTYLLAKYSFIFLLASGISFVLGYWWSRRRFVDVTESFGRIQNIQREMELQIAEIDKHIDVSQNNLEQSLSQKIGEIPQSPPVDIVGLEVRMNEALRSVQRAVENRIAGLPEPQKVEMGEVFSQLNRINSTLIGLPKPQHVDLSEVYAQLNRINQALMNLPELTSHVPTNISGVESQLTSIEERLVDLQTLSANYSEPRALEPLAPAPQAPDDLKKISGVGPHLEGLLNGFGIQYFWQIARWSPTEVAEMDDKLQFKGRIMRDDWLQQAAQLAAGADAAKPPS